MIVLIEQKNPKEKFVNDQQNSNSSNNDVSSQITLSYAQQQAIFNNPIPTYYEQNLLQNSILEIDEQEITNLINMGFDREDIIPAMRAAMNDMSLTIEFLMNGIPSHLMHDNDDDPNHDPDEEP